MYPDTRAEALGGDLVATWFKSQFSPFLRVGSVAVIEKRIGEWFAMQAATREPMLLWLCEGLDTRCQ